MSFNEPKIPRIGKSGAMFVEVCRGLRVTPLLMAVLVLMAAAMGTAAAQTAGEGAIQGTVTDQTGAVIPNATVTATSQAAGTSTITKSSSAGLYELTPLIPGLYTIKVDAPGFKVIKQENIQVNGLNTTGLDLKLEIGTTEMTVTVSEAPPLLQTATSTVGTVITSEVYDSLPLVMNNQQRDPTAFGTLATGAQGGTRAPIFSGTGNYLAEVYLNGIPTTTANQQGDNRVVSNGIPVESVDQMQVITASPQAEYQGAGALGFTVKTGGNQYHGQIIDLVRNTIFDTWGFEGRFGTQNTIVNGVETAVPSTKPAEHQNELSASVGGPVPFTHHKLFFFVNWDQFHGDTGVQPAVFTLPTTLMTQGNFSELGTAPLIFNPLTNSCSGSTCTRQAFSGNMIPATNLSPISLYEQKFLPTPNLPGTVNNYLTGGISGYDNHELVFDVVYDWKHGQRFSFIYSHGVRQSVGYGAELPVPYADADSSIISPTVMIFEHSIPITEKLVNQFDYGFTRFPQPVTAPTYNLSPYRAVDAGITGLPVGQAADNFPASTFGTSTAFPTVQSQWTEGGASDSTHNVVPNAYTVVDNLSWTKGQHNMIFGLQTQWLEDNTTTQSSPSGIYTQSWAAISTANFVGTTLSSTNTGYSYASFLLGAVNSGATSVPLFTETGGRFHPFSPYFQDNWKIRPNLTLNLGLRWDYLPPYHEVQDRWSFFNPNLTNPIVGAPGELQYAGSRGSNISCECRTPVQTYWKNFGPRLGLEWQADQNTVFRAGFAVAYSRAGGVGGRAGDSTGAGQTGFGSTIVLPSANNSGMNAGPSYYLNNSSAFTTAGVANTNFGGAGYTIPAPAGPSAAELTVDTGNYLSGTGSYVSAGGAPSYADPYLSGRAPEFIFYNFGIQKVITRNMTVTATYVGSQSHFVAGAGEPGFWSGQLNPTYIAALGSTLASDGKTPILGAAQATPANVAIAQAGDSAVTVPYPTYVQSSGGGNSTATITRMEQPYPQYSSPPSPEWDNISNLSYNAFELTLAEREFKGVTFTVNYTYSRNVGDDGTTRSAFAVPASVASSGVAIPGNNRGDRDIVATDVPENLNIYGVAKSPFGRNKLWGDNWAARNILGQWQTSGIFTYSSGTPLLVTGSGCTTPASGTCMPDLVPGRKASIRTGGGYGGPGVTYGNFTQKNYLDPTAFQEINYFPLPGTANNNGTNITKIGDSPRSDLNLWSPSHYDLDMALQRSFNVTKERVRFIFRADCFDLTNKVTFSLAQTQPVTAAFTYAKANLAVPSSTTSSALVPAGTPAPPATFVGSTTASPNAAFGRLTGESGNRRFQFSGHITF